MKLLALSIGSWLLGLSAILLTFSVCGGRYFKHHKREGHDANVVDHHGARLLARLCSFFILAATPPGWVQATCRISPHFRIVINLPVILIGLLAIGRTLAVTEALASIGSFVLMGTVFGLGFVWNYQHRSV